MVNFLTADLKRSSDSYIGPDRFLNSNLEVFKKQVSIFFPSAHWLFSNCLLALFLVFLYIFLKEI